MKLLFISLISLLFTQLILADEQGPQKPQQPKVQQETEKPQQPKSVEDQFASMPDDILLKKLPAFQFWLQNTPLTPTSRSQIPEFKDYYKLAQISIHQYFKANPQWKVFKRVNYDMYENLISIQRVEFDLDQFGKKAWVLNSGYYLVYQIVNDEIIPMIVAPYTFYDNGYYKSGVETFFRDKDLAHFTKFENELKQYLSKKNIYRNSVIEFGQDDTFKFLGNVSKFNYKWEDLIINKHLKTISKENSTDFVTNFKQFKELGITPKKGILLAGPPGTGKSFLGQILISDILHGNLKNKASMIIVTARHLRSRYNISTIFNSAQQLAPTAVFMEDIDLLGIKSRYGSNNSSKEKAEVLNEFLNAMDGITDNDGLLVIATTNKAESLDPALTRSGRLGLHLFYGYPTYQDRREFFVRYGTIMALWARGVTVETLAGLSEGLSGAAIIEAISVAKQAAFLENSWKGEMLFLTLDHFKDAFKMVRNEGHNKSLRRRNKSYVKSFDKFNGVLLK